MGMACIRGGAIKVMCVMYLWVGTGVAGDFVGGGGLDVLADLLTGGVTVEMVLGVAVEAVFQVVVVGPVSGGWEVLDLRGAAERSVVLSVTFGMSHSVCK